MLVLLWGEILMTLPLVEYPLRCTLAEGEAGRRSTKISTDV